MVSIHITPLLYTQICLISKDFIVEEDIILICSLYDNLKDFHWLSLVDNINIQLKIDILSFIFRSIINI